MARNVEKVATAIRGSGLTDRITEQLARHGIAGRVCLNGATLRLEGHRHTVALEPQAVEHWAELGHDEQTRVIDRAVAELRRASHQPRRTTSSSWLEWLKLVLVVGATGAGIWAAWHWLGRPARQAMIGQGAVGAPLQPPPAPVPVGVALSPVQEDPAERCRRVQSRIATGGNVSPLDVDGWLVEMIFLNRDKDFGPDSEKLSAFVAPLPEKREKQAPSGAGGRENPTQVARQLIWNEVVELKGIAATTTAVVAAEPLAGVVSGMKSGVRIAWSGKLVEMYFDETGRRYLHRLAAAIHEATDAGFGAVYARCAADSTHQVGTWFRGQDAANATLGMVAAMGCLGEVPPTGEVQQLRRTWEHSLERLKHFDRQRLGLTLAEDGAMLATRTGHWVTLTFAFQDANRATRASHRLTRDLGLVPQP